MGAFLAKESREPHRMISSETQDAVTKMSESLVDLVVGKSQTGAKVALQDMLREVKDRAESTRAKMERIEKEDSDAETPHIRNVFRMGPKMREMRREELEREMHTQWVVANTMWVVLSSIALASLMDLIVQSYHDAIDELMAFVFSNTQGGVAATQEPVRRLLDDMRRHQEKVDAAMQEALSRLFHI